jgi:meiotically up-regulated gene 157 (Mug157) protein
MSHNNNNHVWELALVAQALTSRREELKEEYKETKNQEIIEELYTVTHNLRLVTKQLAKSKK